MNIVAAPLQKSFYTHRNGGDPILLNAFFFLYLAVAGGGAWSLDRLRDPQGQASLDFRREPYALGMLRIAGESCLSCTAWRNSSAWGAAALTATS